MQRYAITFQVKPDSVEQVADLLASYDPPAWLTPEGSRLLGTSIFMHGTQVVRYIEIDGDMGSVMRHLSKQPSIQALERQLDEHLVEPRDMSTPEGARAFFGRAMMRKITTRLADTEVVA